MLKTKKLEPKEKEIADSVERGEWRRTCRFLPQRADGDALLRCSFGLAVRRSRARDRRDGGQQCDCEYAILHDEPPNDPMTFTVSPTVHGNLRASRAAREMSPNRPISTADRHIFGVACNARLDAAIWVTRAHRHGLRGYARESDISVQTIGPGISALFTCGD